MAPDIPDLAAFMNSLGKKGRKWRSRQEGSQYHKENDHSMDVDKKQWDSR